MDSEPLANSADKDRIRILEFQVDQLRRELELSKQRHEEAIYSVAWHAAWPVRVVERALRALFARRDDDGDGADSGGVARSAPEAKPPQPLTRDRIAARIAQRLARPA
ncbi:MAG: hypothetical protein KGM42_15775 [Hyphomicrobiales bacterium]|nr:hypothetical protein [Hyphomicrobiales bacterium]